MLKAYKPEQIEEAYSYALARINLMPISVQLAALQQASQRSKLDELAEEYLESLPKVFEWKDKGHPEYDGEK